jgi:two-component system, NarL family, response regulator NreC
MIDRALIFQSPDMERMLTARERETLQLIADGRTSKEIGWLLGISAKTAECHRSNIMHKLDIHHTAGLVRYAIRSGLVEA